MLKFEFNYLEKTLYIHRPGSPRQAVTKTFTGNYQAQGFVLEPTNHWIAFSIYPNKIRVFYKCVEIEEIGAWPADLAWEDKTVSAESLAPIVQNITYYQKDLTKINPLIFTFAPTDQVQKLNGKWIKKHV